MCKDVAILHPVQWIRPTSQLSYLSSLVGKSVAWKADGRGFESHLRQPIFLLKTTVLGKLYCVAINAFLLCCCLAFLSISWSDCSCAILGVGVGVLLV